MRASTSHKKTKLFASSCSCRATCRAAAADCTTVGAVYDRPRLSNCGIAGGHRPPLQWKPFVGKNYAGHNTTMRVAIVDDEEPARALLGEYLSGFEDVEIVAQCANGFEAVKAVAEAKPDLLLLDIQMPRLDGFEVLELVGRDVGVIFVTAYDKYALRAFEVHAVDYLLKPFGPERLREALNRALVRLDTKQSLPVAELTAAARPVGMHLERVAIRDGANVHV